MSKIGIYSLYSGDEYVGDGTIQELVKLTGLTERTIRFYSTPVYNKRFNSRKTYRKGKGYLVIKIDEEENEDYEREFIKRNRNIKK